MSSPGQNPPLFGSDMPDRTTRTNSLRNAQVPMPPDDQTLEQTIHRYQHHAIKAASGTADRA